MWKSKCVWLCKNFWTNTTYQLIAMLAEKTAATFFPFHSLESLPRWYKGWHKRNSAEGLLLFLPLQIFQMPTAFSTKVPKISHKKSHFRHYPMLTNSWKTNWKCKQTKWVAKQAYWVCKQTAKYVNKQPNM